MLLLFDVVVMCSMVAWHGTPCALNCEKGCKSGCWEKVELADSSLGGLYSAKCAGAAVGDGLKGVRPCHACSKKAAWMLHEREISNGWQHSPLWGQALQV